MDFPEDGEQYPTHAGQSVTCQPLAPVTVTATWRSLVKTVQVLNVNLEHSTFINKS